MKKIPLLNSEYFNYYLKKFNRPWVKRGILIVIILRITMLAILVKYFFL